MKSLSLGLFITGLFALLVALLLIAAGQPAVVMILVASVCLMACAYSCAHPRVR